MDRIVLHALAEFIDDPVKINELFKIQLKNNRNLRQMLNEAGGEPDDLPDGVALEVENEKLKDEIKKLSNPIKLVQETLAENKELKDKNKTQYELILELRGRIQDQIHDLHEQNTCNIEEWWDSFGESGSSVQHKIVRKLELENRKLKEENTRRRVLSGEIDWDQFIATKEERHRRKNSTPVKKVKKVKKSPVKELIDKFEVKKSPVKSFLQVADNRTEEQRSRLCMCRLWDNKSRRSDVQCTVERSSGEDYCKKHLKNIEKNGSWWLGRIDEDRNEEQLGPPGTKGEFCRHLWHDQKNIKKSKSPVKKVVKKSPVKEQVWGECYCCESEYYENEMDLVGTGDGPKYFCLTCSHLTDE